MQIVLNGKPLEIAEGATVASLIATLALDTKRIAVEVNEAVVPRARHVDTTLQPADRIEIVTFVGGG